MSGSLVRGWGNATSDLDVHVVAPEAWQSSIDEAEHVALEPNTLPFEETFVEGRRWDVEYWTTGQVEQVLAKVSEAEFADDKGAWRTLSHHEIALLERLSFAAPADDGAWLGATRERLAASAHRSVLVSLCLRHADGSVEDAAGQLQAGDADSAVLSARRAFHFAVDGLQASLGQFGSLWPKWRSRRMRLVDTPVLPYERYWELETMRTFDPEAPEVWVREVIAVCQRISMEVSV
ncbi:hypothetical protein STRCI_003001 [Streptomyces cinnabarinus]|uniref:Polymerase nucleotidyl transferase domain-containing protein n=1 Tax=Streptomyces cinnabarinus TaxID=67287 RepID=A0ABY7KFA1_9ACTN|nr:hypothetical protein [Streptomyces cinnabarinus]WAZ21802.1 hypothetical protein STRCI_003001 [Streptomyces cinnabarinus]